MDQDMQADRVQVLSLASLGGPGKASPRPPAPRPMSIIIPICAKKRLEKMAAEGPVNSENPQQGFYNSPTEVSVFVTKLNKTRGKE